LKQVIFIFTMITTLVFSSISMATSLSAVGKWQTRDDDNNKPSSIITIWKKGGKYYGAITKIYINNGGDPHARCLKCTDARKNKKVIGMVMLRDLVQESPGVYKDGMILDARSGKEYHCNATVSADGKKFSLRGFIGLTMFGKTSVWYRVK
jgi:uncharacterized protein (DUF2147 family)